MASDDILQCLRERPTTNWDDVFGLESAKQKLLECVVLPIKFPQLFSGSRQLPKGTLLYGLPGTGKSMLGKALATKADEATFYHVTAFDFMSKYEDGEKIIRELFKKARANAPCIILVDDVEAVSSETEEEGEWKRRVKTEFLVQLDECCRNNYGVHVIATTNEPWRIKPAIRRRFVYRLVCPLPDSTARCQMFEHQFADSTHSLSPDDFIALGGMSEGYTGSDICCVTRDALMQPVRVLSAATHFKKVSGPSAQDPDVISDDLLTPCHPDDPEAIEMDWTQVSQDKLSLPKLTMDIVREALSRSKPSVTDEDLARIDLFTREYGPDS